VRHDRERDEGEYARFPHRGGFEGYEDSKEDGMTDRMAVRREVDELRDLGASLAWLVFDRSSKGRSLSLTSMGV
jgi:hypothetical protein